MSRHFSLILLTLFFSCLICIPGIVEAGNLIDGEYNSALGYKIRPPENWVKLDRSSYGGLKENLPKNLAQTDLMRVDVVFYLDTRAPKPAEGEPAPDPAPSENPEEQPTSDENYFADSLSIMLIRNIPSRVDKSIAASIAEESLNFLKESNASYPELTRQETRYEENIKYQPLVMNFRYALNDQLKVGVRFYIFTFNNFTLIASCTNQKVGNANANKCFEAVETLTIINK